MSAPKSAQVTCFTRSTTEPAVVGEVSSEGVGKPASRPYYGWMSDTAFAREVRRLVREHAPGWWAAVQEKEETGAGEARGVAERGPKSRWGIP